MNNIQKRKLLMISNLFLMIFLLLIFYFFQKMERLKDDIGRRYNEIPLADCGVSSFVDSCTVTSTVTCSKVSQASICLQNGLDAPCYYKTDYSNCQKNNDDNNNSSTDNKSNPSCPSNCQACINGIFCTKCDTGYTLTTDGKCKGIKIDGEETKYDIVNCCYCSTTGCYYVSVDSRVCSKLGGSTGLLQETCLAQNDNQDNKECPEGYGCVNGLYNNQIQCVGKNYSSSGDNDCHVCDGEVITKAVGGKVVNVGCISKSCSGDGCIRQDGFNCNDDGTVNCKGCKVIISTKNSNNTINTMTIALSNGERVRISCSIKPSECCYVENGQYKYGSSQGKTCVYNKDKCKCNNGYYGDGITCSPCPKGQVSNASRTACINPSTNTSTPTTKPTVTPNSKPTSTPTPTPEETACYKDTNGNYMIGKLATNTSYQLVSNEVLKCNKIKINSVDVNGKELSNITISITKPNGTVVTEQIGNYQMDRLETGTYKIKITNVPTGYHLDSTEIVFTSKSNSEIEINNSNNIYNKSSSLTLNANISLLINKEKNIEEEKEACYQNANGEYVMGKYAKDSSYTYYGEKCPACYQNISGNYYWTDKPNDNDMIISYIKVASECIKPVEKESHISRIIYIILIIIIVIAIFFTIKSMKKKKKM